MSLARQNKNFYTRPMEIEKLRLIQSLVDFYQIAGLSHDIADEAQNYAEALPRFNISFLSHHKPAEKRSHPPADVAIGVATVPPAAGMATAAGMAPASPTIGVAASATASRAFSSPSSNASTSSAAFSLPNDQAIEKAKKAAAQASSLKELREAIESFEDCFLKHTACQTCFADGDPESQLMIIGEAPGREEDRAGLPFVGKAGQLLNNMLHAIGKKRKEVYITNSIFWRPPGNRTPTLAEMAMCFPFVARHIELVNPKILLTLGACATQSLLQQPKLSILRVRGKWTNYPTAQGKAIPLLPSLHPAFLLRNPQQKQLALQDFMGIKRALSALKS